MHSLRNLPVLILDCQSTGASPKHGWLLEMAWLATRADLPLPDEADCVASLVELPEGARIPSAVRRITGIQRAELAQARSDASLWQDLQTLASETAAAAATRVAPTVIHYARFERVFLDDLRQRTTPDTPMPFDIVCTHDIAKRLLPDLPRRGLRALAGYFGLGVEQLRRSAGHVAATAFVWHHLVDRLHERGIHNWPDLQQWLAATRAPVSRRRRFPMPRAKRLDLPDQPGVYRMLRASGDVLYVGKAASLKKRVNSHFTKQSGLNERQLELLSQARDLAVTETATALEAALLESDLIKTLQPPYNVHLRDGIRDVWFCNRTLSTSQITPDAQHPVGPLPSRWSIRSFASLLKAWPLAVSRPEDTVADAAATSTPRSFAHAVAAAPAHGPDDACFRAGLAEFAQRYDLPEATSVVTRMHLLGLSKQLQALAQQGLLDDGSSRADDDHSWSPKRVARHLERVVLQTGQLLRRAKWLCLLSECSIAFCDPPAGWRMLRVSGTEVIERRDIDADEQLLAPAEQPSPEARKRRFDIAAYDRLRILSTELRRVHHQHPVRVQLHPRSALTGAKLTRVLQLT